MILKLYSAQLKMAALASRLASKIAIGHSCQWFNIIMNIVSKSESVDLFWFVVSVRFAISKNFCSSMR